MNFDHIPNFLLHCSAIQLCWHTTTTKNQYGNNYLNEDTPT